MAQPLSSDTRVESALRRIRRGRRKAVARVISRNLDDAAFFPLRPQFRDRKKRPKMGFEVGTVEELVDQAARAGERMPGRVSIDPGNFKLRTSTDLSETLQVSRRRRFRNSRNHHSSHPLPQRGDRIRIGLTGTIVHIKHVKSLSAEYLPVVRPWLHDSIEDRPVYRMRDNRGTAARALLEVYWALLDAPPGQGYIAARVYSEAFVAARLKDAVVVARRNGLRSLARFLRKRFKVHKTYGKRLKFLLKPKKKKKDDGANKLDANFTTADIEDAKDQRRVDSYLGAGSAATAKADATEKQKDVAKAKVEAKMAEKAAKKAKSERRQRRASM